jgi:hypothetical protein
LQRTNTRAFARVLPLNSYAVRRRKEPPVVVEGLERGVRVTSNSLVRLTDLLWEWVYVVERTTRAWSYHEDAVWLYNERASVGILAGAIWKHGGLAFEEFSIMKAMADGTSSRGRADLYFDFGEDRFQAEAKHAFTKLGGRTGQIDHTARLTELLEQSVADVKCCEDYEATRLGLVFAAPSIPKTEADSMDASLRGWLGKLLVMSHDAIAWVFPSEGSRRESGSRYYPGIALLIRKAG